MYKISTLFLLVTVCLGSTTVLAQTSRGHFYIFDGDAFREAQGAGAILVRDGFLPQVAGENAAGEDRLPAGTGAVALLCYRQSSGGKLKARPRVAPLPGVAVTVQGAGFSLAARTDALGYLILALPPGSYDFKLASFSKKVSVEQGKTSLAPLRAGKRMVD